MKYDKRNPLVSIIVPIYNTGEYLRESLDRIVNQTFSNYEVICVNDGSNDYNTLNILDEYSKKYPIIKCIDHDKRMGAAEARNTGLEAAAGEYVAFLDSDDLFSENLIEILYNSAKNNRAEVCLCTISYYSESGITHAKQDGLIRGRVFNINETEEDGFSQCGMAPWNKLLLRSFLIDNNIRFQNLSSCNDIYFSCMVYSLASRMFCINEKELITWRRDRPGKISDNRDPKNVILASGELFESLKHLDSGIQRKIFFVLLDGGINELRICRDSNMSIEFCEMMRDYLASINMAHYTISKRERTLINCFLNLDPAGKWWDHERIFEFEMEANESELAVLLTEACRPMLWGCGARGKSFLEFCKKRKIRLFGLFDQKPSKVSDVVEELGLDCSYIDLDFMKSQSDLIVAGNDAIYENIKRMNFEKEIINLQEYCPKE